MNVRAFAVAASLAICTASFSLLTISQAASAPIVAVDTHCGATVTPAVSPAREINLVIDDSGSMFADGSTPLTRWSSAKYSLEVFAAMLDANDTLNVYRMSDYGHGGNPGPRVRLSGAEPAQARVDKIHDMELHGGGTPYAPVQRAVADLRASDAATKWLVILSDGEFDGSNVNVGSDLKRWVGESSGDAGGLRVAFLAMGDEAPTIANQPNAGIYFEKAPRTSDLLGKMTRFSNLIFERVPIAESNGTISPDIDLTEALVFAQGGNVQIEAAQTSAGSIEPTSVVDVSWAPNGSVEYGSQQVPATPDKNLRGKLATFQNLPKGDITFDVTGAETIDVFYKPKVDFGVQLLDSAGNKQSADEFEPGTYTLKYGFMDEECNLIESSLLGDIEYSASLTKDGKLVNGAIASGTEIDLDAGEYELAVEATYLDGNSSKADLKFGVVKPIPPPPPPKPPAPASLQVAPSTYDVSKLGNYTVPDGAIAVEYALKDGSTTTPFSTAEWAAVTPESIHVTSESNLDFQVTVSDQIGMLYLLPLAPNGDVYAADTGEIPFTISASHVYNERESSARATASTDVIDDLSMLDRLMNWFKDIGWKLLLLLLLLILLLGYLTKRRFSRTMKSRPTITGTPKRIGTMPENAVGRFRVNRGRKFLPFVADTGTLTYAPSSAGFRSMKLKAGSRRTMIVTNWRDLAKRNNVEINGTELNDESTRAPMFGSNGTIVATTDQMTYEMTPSA